MTSFQTLKKFNVQTIGGVLVSLLLYVYLGYFFERSQFLQLIFAGAILFSVSWWLYARSSLSVKTLSLFALLFRAVFLFSIPFLSQDFYRFVWDGHLTASGINPYLKSPDQWMQGDTSFIPNASRLYAQMGSLSASHYTNYPPLNQVCFAIASWLGGSSLLTSVVVLRLIIISADIGIYFVGQKLLDRLSLPPKNILLYTLNPLVIMELTGNLHFEGVMAFFILLSILFLVKSKWKGSAIFLSASIITKLLPLILLPVFIYNLGWRKWMRFCLLVCTLVGVSFIPFLSGEMMDNFKNTVDLWFTNFEFNASIYYVLRQVGYWISGYNQIAVIGRILMVAIFLGVLVMVYVKKPVKPIQIMYAMLGVLTLYFLLSTTVHPWYLITPLVVSLFTHFRFVWIWSALVLLSYSAYMNPVFDENFWLLAVEYCAVLGVIAYEFRNSPTQN